MALNEFEGTLMLVSHDRALLREVCDEFWLVAHGQVLPFDGDLDDYQKWLLETSRAVARGAAPPPLPGGSGVGADAGAAASTPAGKPTPAPAPKTAAAPVAGGASKPGGNRADDRKQAAQARSQLAAQTRPLRVEVQQIDARLEKLSDERAEIESALASGGLAGSEIADAGRRLNHIGAEVAMLEERWLELSEQIEALQAGA
jgi:ATP-binding cassette subfamily F protein 3